MTVRLAGGPSSSLSVGQHGARPGQQVWALPAAPGLARAGQGLPSEAPLLAPSSCWVKKVSTGPRTLHPSHQLWPQEESGESRFPSELCFQPPRLMVDHRGGGPLGGGLASPEELRPCGVRHWPLGGGRAGGGLALSAPTSSFSSQVRRQAVGTKLSLPLKTRLPCRNTCAWGGGGVGSRAPALGHSPHAERTGVPELPKRPSSCSCDAGTLRRHLFPP